MSTDRIVASLTMSVCLTRILYLTTTTPFDHKPAHALCHTGGLRVVVLGVTK